MATKSERKARRERYKNATPEQKSNYAKYQRENFKNIAASFPRDEAQKIAETLHALHVTPAQVIRAAWYALITDGETAAERIRADAETARAAYAERLHRQQNAQDAQDAITTDTTGPGAPDGSNPGTVTG